MYVDIVISNVFNLNKFFNFFLFFFLGHVERMDEYRMAWRVLMAEVSGGRVRGRPRLR